MLPPGVPSLDSLSHEWLDADELEHLHSLRNQWGQAHVNADLTSISWLAIPPYAGGYRTGVLRVDGQVAAAASFNWAPWGVRRRGFVDGIGVETDTRLGYASASALWRITVTNETDASRTVDVAQELLAPVAHSEVDWGWLHGAPWNEGHCHDFFSTERVRADVLSDQPKQVQLVPPAERFIRLGRPRIPGIQRDEDDEPMLLEDTLPDHTTSDARRVRPPAAAATIGWVEVRTADGSVRRVLGPWTVAGLEDEIRLGLVPLQDGGEISVGVRVDAARDGVIFTHGNHPDSLQFAIERGLLVARVGGERMDAGRALGVGDDVAIAARVSRDGAILFLDGAEVARTSEWWGGQRWTAEERDGAMLVTDGASPARSAFAFTVAPDRLDVEGQRGVARWRVDLAPGQSATIGVVLQLGTDAVEVAGVATAAAGRFDEVFAQTAESWRTLWANAFIPGNPDHSGYVPVFETDDDGLALTYYHAILQALYLRNSGVSELGPVFLAGGPRLGATVSFYWDEAEWARLHALLEPKSLRAWILAALAQPYDASHSFDTKNLLPVGNNYSANDYSLFNATERYIGVTGDFGILDEVAAGRTVLQHLREMATRPRSKRAAFADTVLVDFGRDTWELLECVPNYRDVIVSFNAGYAGMLRAFATILDLRGEAEEATELRAEGDRLAEAVLGLYAGEGRWNILHPEGVETIGHCLDFQFVASRLADDLTPEMRDEMVAFVTGSLLDGDWMRALAPDDPIAPFSDRPDHGAAGAFAAWPANTSLGLARLGRPDIAAAFLARLHRSRSGAAWGQAMEAMGNGRFQVAERGVSCRDTISSSASAESIIAGLFGIRTEPGAVGAGALESPFGRLRNVRAIGFDLPAPTWAEAPAEGAVRA